MALEYPGINAKKEEKQWLEAILITTANFVGIKDKYRKYSNDKEGGSLH